MEWYLILLICLAYYIIWIITSIFISRFYDEDNNAIILGLLWPFFLPIFIVMSFVKKYG